MPASPGAAVVSTIAFISSPHNLTNRTGGCFIVSVIDIVYALYILMWPWKNIVENIAAVIDIVHTMAKTFIVPITRMSPTCPYKFFDAKAYTYDL